MADPEAPVPFARRDEIAAEVVRVAREISADHPRGVTLVGVLKGSAVFLSDLARHITVPVRLDFIAVAPYDGATARTRVVKDLSTPVEDQDVILVSGAADTGFTSDFLLRHVRDLGPSSLQTCVLTDRTTHRILPIAANYVAFDAGDAFLVGYGLDFAGRYRNLPGLWHVDGAALAANPDRYVAALYEC